uniref:Uncharacterized protein n=1 Tax=Cucumis melo TaxID=3656 RepID=A0A9I9DSN8_CUCME
MRQKGGGSHAVAHGCDRNDARDANEFGSTAERGRKKGWRRRPALNGKEEDLGRWGGIRCSLGEGTVEEEEEEGEIGGGAGVL